MTTTVSACREGHKKDCDMYSNVGIPKSQKDESYCTCRKTTNPPTETVSENKNKEDSMKDLFEKIIFLCEQETDEEGTLSEIRLKAKNRVIRYEWEEKYGIKLDSNCKFAEYDYCNLGEYENLSYYKDGYISHKQGSGRNISWSEDNRQPVNEWIYEIHFSTGAYIFGEDYEGQKQLFQDFFEELRTYKPDFEDLHNHNLYWKPENAKEIISQFKIILKKYHDKNREELKERKIKKLQAELKSLEANL